MAKKVQNVDGGHKKGNAKMPELVIGLTGPFGSGCSFMAKVLAAEFNFEYIKISTFIEEEIQGHWLYAIDIANPRRVRGHLGASLRL